MAHLGVAFRGVLAVLIVIGLWSSLQLSFLTVTSKAPCPGVLGVPICYLVTLGYLSMFTSQLPPLVNLNSRLFYPAWALVFFIAVSGTGTELVAGDVCPRTEAGIPMCYISLAFCMAILLLYQLESWSSNRVGKT